MTHPRTPDAFLAEVARAGLTGRGGAGFDTATKLRLAREHRATLVVNACDGEIGATKDLWVLTHHLDELVRGAALATGDPRRRVVYAAHRGSRAASLLASHGLSVLEVPRRYTASEEIALVSVLHGGEAVPMTRRAPFVLGGRDSRGRRIRPTLVLNAETTWRLAQIEAHGAEWFASVGTPDAPGPRLVTVRGGVQGPVVVETASGARLLDIVDAGGGMHPDAGHVLLGGLAGVLLTAEEARALTWSPAGTAAHGGTLGSGVVEVLDPTRCPLDVVGDLLDLAEEESAGQCGPCVLGLPSAAAEWRLLAAHPAAAGRDAFEVRLALLAGRGACRHPDGVARFAASALRTLTPHLQAHAEGRCPRGRSDVAVHPAPHPYAPRPQTPGTARRAS